MFALVPALLRNAETERRLLRMLSRFPSSAPATLVLITQGNRITIPALPGICAILHKHFDSPIGKWAAIRHGLSLIARSADEPIILIDADDPITDTSMVRAFTSANSFNTDYVIGDRSMIFLHADDQLSPQSRIFVEIFSNTLLLLTIQTQRPIPSVGSDIQSGLYIISGRARQAISLDYVRDYGGELALYYELASAGFVPSTLGIESNNAAPSSYSIEKIVRSIAALPFFQSISREQFSDALHLAPRLYARFLRQSTKEQFQLEIVHAFREVFPSFSSQA